MDTIFMNRFYITDGKEIVNVIMAANKESAEAATGMTALDAATYPELNIGATLVKGEWVNPEPVVEA